MGLFTLIGNAGVAPPPGIGLFTETFSVTPCVKSLEGTVVWTSVELTNVVVRTVPFTKTLDDLLKLLPVTARRNASLPTTALEGESAFSCGTGLFTVNVATMDGPLPGFDTVISGEPAIAIALAGILACNSSTLTNVEVTLVPSKVTTTFGVKKLPSKDNVN